MRTKRKIKDRATLYINNAGELTKLERKRIASWLIRHAKQLVEDGWDYYEYFSGHYIREK